MRISSVYIDGYRRFKAQQIHFENGATVLAGANNSGKTSLIDLLRVVLGGEGAFRADDFGASDRYEWFSTLVGAAIEGEESYKSLLESDDFGKKAPSIEVRIEVKYNPDVDDIRQFADYLMDLDEEKTSFYFQYLFCAKPDKLIAGCADLYDAICKAIKKSEWTSLKGVDVGSSEFLALQTKVDAVLIACSKSEAFFADETFSNTLPMDSVPSFSRLFNFKAVKASRALDDTNEDKSGGLNHRLIEVAKEDEGWSGLLSQLPDQVLDAIQALKIRELTTDEALKSLNTVIDSISSTNGARQSDLFLDFHITEEHAVQMIARAMQTRYLGGGVPLGEASQGLGYSNLIYLHLEAESFIRSVSSEENGFLVNILVLEEPESHMHPQMQNAFIKHLFSRVTGVIEFQALVTTHSSEIIRSSAIEQLRVLKTEENNCRVVDLRKFHTDHVAGKSEETQRLYSFLYAINFSDVLFADKVIMYEGDTERMYIQALIKEREDLLGLRTQYISYVQVGGAYAHVYKPLVVDTLHLKTVIITDLDYEKNVETTNFTELAPLTATNATLNEFFGKEEPGKKTKPTIERLLEKISNETGVALLPDAEPAAIAFQSSREGYARTFEEAILAMLLETEVWESRAKEEWVTFREKSGLVFSIPRKNPAPTIRQVVSSTSNQKTDFMYSLLLRPELMEKVPPYILCALKWLDA